MKNLLFFLFTLPSFLYGNEHTNSSDPSYFEVLEDSMVERVLPSIENLTRVEARSGRCFSAEAPNTPMGAVVKFRRINEDVGPLGDLYPKYEVSVLSGGQPNQYDNGNQPSGYWLKYQPSEGLVSFNQGSSQFYFYFAVWNNYLVLETAEESRVMARCYFFNPGYEPDREPQTPSYY